MQRSNSARLKNSEKPKEEPKKIQILQNNFLSPDAENVFFLINLFYTIFLIKIAVVKPKLFRVGSSKKKSDFSELVPKENIAKLSKKQVLIKNLSKKKSIFFRFWKKISSINIEKSSK